MPLREKSLSAGTVASLVFATAAAVTFAAAPPANAATTGTGISYTLEGCRNNGGLTLPNTDGDFICPDAAYTTGNLGKGWNELDLVPVRVTIDAGNSHATNEQFVFVLAVDYMDGGRPGYDVLAAPVLNTDLSSGTCGTATVSGPLLATPGVGGTDTTLYRTITITGQTAGSECVYDSFARLALGSHLYPGASLHFNLLNDALGTAGIGAKDVSIPVNEILPQELDKDMTATQGSDHVWNVQKTPTPATVSFANTCDGSASLSTAASITVTWTKLAATASGPITVVTNVYATNPAARTITVNVTDRIRSGVTVLDTVSTGVNGVDVPANTANFLVLSHQTTVPAGTTDLNDVATATYTDKVTGVAVPGTTTATASATVQGSGVVSNGSATITDVESITGAGFSFSVDSFSGASGSFDNGYVAGTVTTGNVSWTSATQTDSGSVTFNKTIHATAGTSSSGSLADTATLTGSQGFSATANASIAISSNALVSLTINKTIPVVLDANDGTKTFTFNVTGPGGYASSPTISFASGDGGALDVHSTTLTGLAPGTYNVAEVTLAPFVAQAARNVVIALPACGNSTTFNNEFGPASARVAKDTNPDGSEAGWMMTLNGPGTPVGGETVTTTGAGFITFATVLEEGSYTITETAKAGWDQTGASSECSFTVDYPADADRVFSCTFTNTQRGALKVNKSVVANDSGNTLSGVTFTICITGPSYPTPTVQNGGCKTTTIAGGDLTWTNLLPGTYTVSEANPGSSWIVGIQPTSVNVAAGATASAVASTVTNTHKGKARVVKTVSKHDGSNAQAPSGTESFTFQLRQGTTDIMGNPGTLIETATANAGNGGQFTFTALLTPGQVYQVCETGIDPAWKLQLSPGPQFVPEQWTDATRTTLNPGVINDVYCVNFTAQPGPDPTVITANNFRPPEGFALTIGFWKNHASCSGSNGSQDAVLNQVLASFPIAAGQSTHGVYIGDVYVDTCLEAVRLLNKSTINTNKKFASDPLFNLAAQLLAAKLNVQAGAATCAAAINAINAGQALLDSYNFTGTATTKLKASQVAGANAIARKLDFYNNNLLC